MYTFRLNLTTKNAYDEMVDQYNQQFGTNFTIKSLLPYAADHFVKHGNAKYLKHYNLVKSYIDQEFNLEKDLYLRIKKYQTNDITLQDILNFVLNLYIVPFKAGFIKKCIDLERTLLVLNHYHLLNNGYTTKESKEKDYSTEYVITVCPICSSDSFYINPDNMEIGCYKNDCPVNTSNLTDIIALIHFIDKIKYPEIINTIFDLVIKNYKSNLPEIEKLKQGIIKSAGRKKAVKNRIKELENMAHMATSDETASNLKNEILKLESELKEIERKEEDENRNINIRNHIMMKNGTKKYDYLIQKGFRQDILEQLGVFYLDKDMTKDIQTNIFRYRICYPVYSVDGQLVGIQARSIIDDDGARREFLKKDSLFSTYFESARKRSLVEMYSDTRSLYELSPFENYQYRLWRKINKKVLNTFGFDKSENLYLLYKYIGHEKQKVIRVILVEGIKDAIKLYQYNLKATAVVSSMGCSLSDQQIDLLKKYFPNAEIILGYDMDFSGVEGNFKAYFKLSEMGFSKISFIEYPNGVKDFGDFIGSKDTRSNIVNTLISRKNYNKYLIDVIKVGLLLSQNVLFNRGKE